MFYMRSHEPVRGQNREVVLRYTRICRDAMDPSKKRKFNGVGDQVSHIGHWEIIKGNVTKHNLEG